MSYDHVTQTNASDALDVVEKMEFAALVASALAARYGHQVCMIWPKNSDAPPKAIDGN